MNGGKVEMENPAGGDAIYAYQAPVALNGVTILNGGGAEDAAGGVASEKGSLSLTNTHISVESEPPQFPVVTAADSSVELTGVTVRQNGTATGVQVEESPVSANGLNVEMVDPAATAPAVDVANEGGASTFSHLDTTYGTWIGPALWAIGGDVTVADSRLVTNPLSSAAALKYDGPNAQKGLLIQRSLLQAGANAKLGALQDERASATLDSSEVLGGRNAIYFEALEKDTALTLTVSASTLDAGAAGIAADTAGTTGVEAVSSALSGSSAKVVIQGSIVLEKQIASFSPGDATSIGCSYSALPSQSQTAGAGAGAIACTSGSSGNTEASPLSSLFPEPLSGYGLSPSSSAVDSVPASALPLPAGITPSTTDAAGHPRVVDGNGDCAAVQDKGALELQGHSAPCPVAVPILALAKPIAGVLSTSRSARARSIRRPRERRSQGQSANTAPRSPIGTARARRAHSRSCASRRAASRATRAASPQEATATASAARCSQRPAPSRTPMRPGRATRCASADGSRAAGSPPAPTRSRRWPATQPAGARSPRRTSRSAEGGAGR